MSDLKLCRICLRTEAKVYKYDKFQLKYYYEEVMALKVYDNDSLPQYFCYECAALLHRFHKFKEKCYSGQKALKEMLWNGPITYELVYKLDRAKYNLKSGLQLNSINTSSYPSFKIKTEDNIDYNSDSANSEPYDSENIDKISNTNDHDKMSTHSADIDVKKENDDGRKECGVRREKHTLDEKYWKRLVLTEEEAVRQFRQRAEDSKYQAAAFKCTDCFRSFSKKDMLKRHLLRKHNESLGDHECRLCRMRFRLRCYLRRHVNEHYSRFQCLRCDRICPLENSALLHDQFHSGVIKRCQHCNEEFLLSSTYYTHLRTHRSEHVCTQCGASFVSQAGLNMHKRLKHVADDIESPDDDEEVNTYCARCDMRFENRKAYEEHLFHSAMHSQKEYELDPDLTPENTSAPRKILGKRKQALITNGSRKKKTDDAIKLTRGPKRIRRKKIKPTTCHQCGKHFATQAACLKHHVTEHPRTCFFPPAARHICEICGASLAPGSVAVHQNMHTREKVHTCDTCGKQFYASIGLKRHLVTHTGEKPFACNLCDKRFTQSNSMKLHYRTFHLKQPYPKRNRRKKHDAQEECAEESSSGESDSLPEPEMACPDQTSALVPVPTIDAPSGDSLHYLTLS